MKVIAICGTNGSGKGTVAEYLLSLNLKEKFEYVSSREIIKKLAQDRGIELNNRTDFINFTEKFYADGGSLHKTFLQENLSTNKFFIIEAIRRVREINDIREICPNSIIIGVDADSKIRYERILKRNSVTDNVSYEKFIEEEMKESQGTIDTVMNLPKCIEISDVKLINDGKLEDFKKQIDEKVLTNSIFEVVL